MTIALYARTRFVATIMLGAWCASIAPAQISSFTSDAHAVIGARAAALADAYASE